MRVAGRAGGRVRDYRSLCRRLFRRCRVDAGGGGEGEGGGEGGGGGGEPGL